MLGVKENQEQEQEEDEGEEEWNGISRNISMNTSAPMLLFQQPY